MTQFFMRLLTLALQRLLFANPVMFLGLALIALVFTVLMVIL